jgi:hypothetical protein
MGLVIKHMSLNLGACVSVVFETLSYKPEGREFEIR